MFTSFYSGVGLYSLQSYLETELSVVEHGGSWGSLSPVKIPYAYLYTVKF